MTLTEFMSAVNTIVSTTVNSWMRSVIDFILDYPLIYVPIISFFFVGGVVTLVCRLLRG